jgi:hypothetical protein
MPFCTLYFSLAFIMYKYQLLYVYINEYQSGGFMWYAVFNRSMVALICGVVTLLCYLAIRKTFVSGPFYLLFPLPMMIGYFWYDCENRFRSPALVLFFTTFLFFFFLHSFHRIFHWRVPLVLTSLYNFGKNNTNLRHNKHFNHLFFANHRLLKVD